MARSIRCGIFGLPQSRPVSNVQSKVMISPTAPAARARSTRASISARPPIQYTWKNVCGLAATTSSTGLLPNELSPTAVPRLAAARATATSPSGCTACTPVGEQSTGIDTGWPSTVVARSRLAGSPPTCGVNPSSPNAATLSFERRALLRPGHDRPVHRFRQPLSGAALRHGDRLEPPVAHRDPPRPYLMTMPASTGSATPVTYRASSEASHSTALLMSTGSTQGIGSAFSAGRRPASVYRPSGSLQVRAEQPVGR